MEKIIQIWLNESVKSNRKSGLSDPTPEQIKQLRKDIEDQLSQAQLYKLILNQDFIYNAIKPEFDEIRKVVNFELGENQAKAQKNAIRDKVKNKMRKEHRSERKWNVENRGKYTDAYKLLAHWMFFNKDDMWEAFVKVYPETLKKYGYKPDDDKWLDNALDKAEELNERDFKEFYYAVVGAKIIEGHMKRLFNWRDTELIEELKGYDDADKLIKIAKDMKVTIEIPDSRDSKFAGLYIIWRPRQLYALVKTLRKTVSRDIHITWDFEHLAGQGVDPTEEMKRTIYDLGIKDLGKYTLSIHCNKPNPLHGHVPIELGDEEVYTLLWLCRMSGMGDEENDVFLFFERGGGQDPFKQSVDALKLMVPHLENKIHPKKLPMDVYGLKMTAGDEDRQKQIVLAHRFELVKELMQVPEEEWGWLSGIATRKGKTKEWKKNELHGL